jgi:hypothetical protein
MSVWQTEISELIVLFLITNFAELRVEAGRSRTRVGRPHAVSVQPMLIHTFHAVLMALCRGLERSLRERHDRGMAGEWHGVCESNTAAMCKSNGKDKI